MKKSLLSVFVIISVNVFGQTCHGIDNQITNKMPDIDTTLKVIYADTLNNVDLPACFLNGKFVNMSLLETLNPNLIETINLIKGDVVIDSILYKGQLKIITKSNYTPKIISLQKLKEKYTDFKNKSVVFMLNGTIINADYNKYILDENYILRIIIDKVVNDKELINLGLIKLLTKTKTNIDDLGKIHLR